MIDGNVTGKSIKGKITSIPKVDTTLSKEGQCAEAKATGEALNNKVNLRDIADNLVTADAAKVLSANQGVELKGLIATEAQNRKNAIDELTNVTIKDINDKIADANGDIDDLGNNLTAAEQNITKNQQDIEELKAQGGVFTYVGNGNENERRINVGFNCNGLLVKSTGVLVIIQGSTSAALWCGGKTNQTGTVVAAGGAYRDGELVITPYSISKSEQNDDGYATWTEYSENTNLNKDGVEYTCIPL